MTDHDHDSNLTDSIDDENFIALLQYRDAYHILNLSSPSESGSPTVADVEKAYTTAKEQALLALEQFEAKRQASSHQGGRNMFFISHQNYLELKLQALDQAYEQLMPPMEGMIVEKRISLHAEEVDFDSPPKISKEGGWTDHTGDESLSVKESVEEGKGETPSNVPSARDFVGTGKSGDAAIENLGANASLQRQQQQPGLHKREPSEDELDTIDIYFRPTGNVKKGSDPPAKHRTNTPSSEHPSDVSSCTWDGSSIFSMISQTKKNWEDAASEGGLSDVLGPKTSANANVTRTEAAERNHRRPPVGINVKHNMKKQAQISPTSVSCFPPSIHNDHHYDNTSTLGRGKRMMRKSRFRHSHEATEAARMGILRALSEDNSECLSLDGDEEYNNYHFNMMNETQDTSGEAEFDDYNFQGDDQDMYGRGKSKSASSKIMYQGKTDQLSTFNNSIMGSTFNENSQLYEISHGTRLSSEAGSHDKRNAATNPVRDRPTSPRPLSHSSRQQTKSKYSSDGQYESLIQNGIVGTLELADEFCTALNSCWKDGVVGSPNGLAKTLSRAGTVATAAFDAAAYELERSTKPLDQCRVEDESTMYSRSTYDGDSAYHNRSVYTTDEESTAFNTLSSFSRRAELPSMMEKRQRASKSSATSQTQTRMLV